MRTSILKYIPLIAVLEHKNLNRFKVISIYHDKIPDSYFSSLPNASVFKTLEDYEKLIGLSLVHDYKAYDSCDCTECHTSRVIIDLNSVDLTSFNPNTRRWRKNGPPSVS